MAMLKDLTDTPDAGPKVKLDGGSLWHLAQVRPNCLHIAERNLVRQAFPVFCPRQIETRRRASRFVSVEAPLFPGYLFIAFDPATAPWRAINSTYGVSKLVSFGDYLPSPVPLGLVDGLMARCDDSGHLLPPDTLVAGDKVEVLSGPFAQFVATVEQIAPNRRVWMLIEFLGGSTRMSMTPDNLKKV